MGLCCGKICDDEEDGFPIDARNVGVQTTPLSRPVQLPINSRQNIPTVVSRPRPRPPQPPVTCQPPISVISRNYIEETNDASGEQITDNNDLILDLLRALPVRHHTMYIPSTGHHALERLDDNSERFLRNKLFSHSKFNANYVIDQAFRVWNPFLMAQYAMNKKKYESKYKERHLFHGTALGAVEGIVSHNFDWRKTKESWYGQGVYFAKNPFYVALYSLKRQNSTAKSKIYVMIVAKVLIEIEESSISKSDADTVVPEEGHTTISEHRHELIKYDDACFYPEFVVYFHQRPKI